MNNLLSTFVKGLGYGLGLATGLGLTVGFVKLFDDKPDDKLDDKAFEELYRKSRQDLDRAYEEAEIKFLRRIEQFKKENKDLFMLEDKDVGNDIQCTFDLIQDYSNHAKYSELAHHLKYFRTKLRKYHKNKQLPLAAVTELSLMLGELHEELMDLAQHMVDTEYKNQLQICDDSDAQPEDKEDKNLTNKLNKCKCYPTCSTCMSNIRATLQMSAAPSSVSETTPETTQESANTEQNLSADTNPIMQLAEQSNQ
jgi:hypothetical protein